MSKTAAVTRNLDGQRLGRKGMEARDRLITAVINLLEHRPLRDLRISDIAREAAAQPPSFYRYFATIEDLLLAAIAERASTGPALVHLVSKPWPPGKVRLLATEFSAAFLHYWQEHYTLLHIMRAG